MWPLALALAGQFLAREPDASIPPNATAKYAPELLPFASGRASTEAELADLLAKAKQKLSDCESAKDGPCEDRAKLGASVKRYEQAQGALRRIVNSTAPQKLHEAEAHVDQLRANVVDLRSLEAVAVARQKFLQEQQRELADAENETVKDLHSVENVLSAAQKELKVAEVEKAQKYKVAETWATQVQSTVIAAKLSDEMAEDMYADALSKEHAADAKYLRAKELFAKAEALADRVDDSIARKSEPIATPRVEDGLGGWGNWTSGGTTSSTTTTTTTTTSTTSEEAEEKPEEATPEAEPEEAAANATAAAPSADVQADDAAAPEPAADDGQGADATEPDMAAIDAELSAVR